MKAFVLNALEALPKDFVCRRETLHLQVHILVGLLQVEKAACVVIDINDKNFIPQKISVWLLYQVS